MAIADPEMASKPAQILVTVVAWIINISLGLLGGFCCFYWGRAIYRMVQGLDPFGHWRDTPRFTDRSVPLTTNKVA